MDPGINSGDNGTVLLDEGMRLFGGIPQLNPKVHPMLGEKIVCAAISTNMHVQCLLAYLS